MRRFPLERNVIEARGEGVPAMSSRGFRPHDVRAPRERDQKYIAGSLGIPLNRLVEKRETLPKGRPLLVYCAGGYRSSIAASLLERSGFDHVAEIAGGIAGWEGANPPVQTAQSLS